VKSPLPDAAGAPRNPDVAAAQWIAAIESGGLSEAERAAFDAWRSVREHATAFSRAEELWSGVSIALDDLANSPDVLRERERILARSGRKRYFATAGVAAGVALTVALTLSGIAGHLPEFTALRGAWTGLFAPGPDVYSTSIGQRSMVTLPDGSELSLNTDSVVEVRFDHAERKLVLLRGQALFKVAKGQSRPFVVHAGGQRIVATGTAFDVRLDDSMLELTMVEGQVLVHSPAGPASRGDRKPTPGLPLHAGERLVARAGRPVAISAVDTGRATSWMHGKLVFLDTTLDDAIAETNRYSTTKVILADPRLAGLKVSGVFRTGQPGQFARAVTEIHPVAVRTGPDGTIFMDPRMD
jgi:transmembrane sensor